MNQPPLGQDNYFMGNQHNRLNSSEKRQMHLKWQWKIQDMDPHGQPLEYPVVEGQKAAAAATINPPILEKPAIP